MDEIQDAIIVSDDTMKSMVEDSRNTDAVLALRAKVQHIRDKVLKDGVHYGILPGTKKPTLYQEGADSLGLTFKIAFTFENVMEGDGIDEIAVRSKCIAAYHGELLGDCEGYASSNEEKYKWRKVVHTNEYDATDPDRRRMKWQYDGTAIKQVRTEPADIVNTVLKMAQKRAKLGVIKTVLAIGEMFGVDLDDVPKEIREELVGDQAPVTEPKKKKKTKDKAKKKASPAPVSTKADPDEAAEELANVGQVTAFKKAKETDSYTLWAVEINGNKFITFDEKVASVAQSAKAFESTVAFEYEPPKEEGRAPKLTAMMEVKGD